MRSIFYDRRRRGRLVVAGCAIAIVVLSVLIGVTMARSSNSPDPLASNSAQSSDSAPGARGIAVTTLSGERLSLPDRKPTVLSFVSATCLDCIGDVQTLGTVRATAPDSATFLAVGIDQGRADLPGLLAAAGHPDLPATQDSSGALLRAYHVVALGTIVVLSPSGEVTYREIKPSPDAVRQAIASVTSS